MAIIDWILCIIVGFILIAIFASMVLIVLAELFGW